MVASSCNASGGDMEGDGRQTLKAHQPAYVLKFQANKSL